MSVKSITKEALGLVILVIFLAVVGGMTVLGTDGSLVIYNILNSLVDWSELIALGIALGLVGMFLAIGGDKGIF